MKRRTYGFMITGVLAASLALAACSQGGGDVSKTAALSQDHYGMHGKDSEQYETTASAAQMPAFLAHYTDRTQASYKTVDSLKEVLKYINCYCGCMDYEDHAHDSLYRCFVAENTNGEIKWTDHGAQCGICLEELNEVNQLHAEGKSVQEIQKAIDAKFKGEGKKSSSEVHPI
ncbi:PCYCGC motif-containing (lipo)protein [Paenibacillus sp. JX-17]|uniref:PCYCGC motif-containing (Lipo)protein n=1 Tax=Paenibacillus lacisoli TaxID=3064525 RepID=A0ABT9C9S3_9BACL|nr:PCYCGC motif-containing (lipo)protein [Paenibacillus sp. JX-17]MDO7905992.1 PCYCGC motif-containing (lipo)protein [Paenibacillus sp. JX-17]